MDTRELDRDIAALRAHAEEWARLPVPEKLAILRRLRPRVDAVADRWVAAAAKAKGLPEDSPWVGEEWLSGPYSVLHAITALERTFVALAAGRSPLPARRRIRARPDGQVVVEVFPATGWDRLLVSGVRAEVWMDRSVTVANLEEHVARRYRRPPLPAGRVALVLGAGNVASIAPLDILYKLYGEGQVCMLKTSLVNDYLAPFIAEAFGELLERGFLRIALGGSETGDHLARHPGIDEIHMTGSDRTYDAVRFGPGVEGAERKRRGEPINTKRITAELGGVGPTIVVPGPWSDADIRFQAEHVASQKLVNGGFNCIAAQVLVLPQAWARSAELLDSLRAVVRSLPPRPAYYPGAAERQVAAVRAHPGAELLDAPAVGGVPRTLIAGIDPQDAGSYGFTEEFFGGVLAQTALPGRTPLEFLRAAVEFSNARLRGTLGANIIVHPATLRELGPAFEDALAALRYGAIGVNGWVALAYLLSESTWGAFPGHTDQDIQSGRGVVHNAYLFDRPEKTITYGPFEPFHRALLRGRFHVSPKPPWFVTHRRAAEVGRRLTRFAANPGLRHIPGIFAAALRP